MTSIVIRQIKRNQKIRIIYREIYHIWRKTSVSLLVFFLKIFKLKSLTRNDLLAHSLQYNLREFGSKELVNFGQFYTFQPIPQNIAQNIYPMEVEIVKPFVCEIINAEIVGSPPIAFDSDGHLILETTLPRFTPVESHIAKNVSIKTLALHKWNKPKHQLNTIEIACLFTNPWSGNFWHWTVDTLPQLEGVEYYREQTGIKPKLIVESNMRSWQRDSLKLLGYGEDDWIVWYNSKKLVKRLIVPSFRRSYQEIHGEISVAACRWLRQRILSNISSQESNNKYFSPKIFISRRKALGRRIINENDVVEALDPLGFSTYILEEMSYIEQVKLFAQAKVIVAPHGAGLTNLIFADNPIILELFGAYVGREFANLARGMGFKYGCLGCSSPRGEVRQKDGDLVVNVTKLQNLLAIMQDEQKELLLEK